MVDGGGRDLLTFIGIVAITTITPLVAFSLEQTGNVPGGDSSSEAFCNVGPNNTYITFEQGSDGRDSVGKWGWADGELTGSRRQISVHGSDYVETMTKTCTDNKERCNTTAGCWNAGGITGCTPIKPGYYNTGNGTMQSCSYPKGATTAEWPNDPRDNDYETGHVNNDCLWQITCPAGTYYDIECWQCNTCPKYRLKGNVPNSAQGRGNSRQTGWYGRRTLNDTGVCPECTNGALPNDTQAECNTVYVYFFQQYVTINDDKFSIRKNTYVGSPKKMILDETQFPTFDKTPAHILKGEKGNQISVWNCSITDITWPGPELDAEKRLTKSLTNLKNYFYINPGEKIPANTLQDKGKGYIFCAPEYGTPCDRNHYCDGTNTADQTGEQGYHKCPDQFYTDGSGKSSVNDCKVRGAGGLDSSKLEGAATKFCDSKGCFYLPFSGYIGAATQ